MGSFISSFQKWKWSNPRNLIEIDCSSGQFKSAKLKVKEYNKNAPISFTTLQKKRWMHQIFYICWQMVSCWFMLLMLYLPLLYIFAQASMKHSLKSMGRLMTAQAHKMGGLPSAHNLMHWKLKHTHRSTKHICCCILTNRLWPIWRNILNIIWQTRIKKICNCFELRA